MQGERIMTKFVSTVIALMLLQACCRAQTNTVGIVSALIIGPSESTPETLWEKWKPGQVTNFWTTIKIVDVKKDLNPALKWRTIKVLTLPFPKKLLGQTVNLRLRHYNPPVDGMEFRFPCSDLNDAFLSAYSSEKSQK